MLFEKQRDATRCNKATVKVDCHLFFALDFRTRRSLARVTVWFIAIIASTDLWSRAKQWQRRREKSETMRMTSENANWMFVCGKRRGPLHTIVCNSAYDTRTSSFTNIWCMCHNTSHCTYLIKQWCIFTLHNIYFKALNFTLKLPWSHLLVYFY